MQVEGREAKGPAGASLDRAIVSPFSGGLQPSGKWQAKTGAVDGCRWPRRPSTNQERMTKTTTTATSRDEAAGRDAIVTARASNLDRRMLAHARSTALKGGEGDHRDMGRQDGCGDHRWRVTTVMSKTTRRSPVLGIERREKETLR